MGTTAEQAEWMADKVRTAMLARMPSGDFTYQISLTGYAVMSRDLDTEAGVDAAGGVYSYVQRFAIEVTSLNS